MSIINLAIAVIILIWSAVHTVSYAAWTWKEKNKLGGAMLLLLAVLTIAVPAYVAWFHR